MSVSAPLAVLITGEVLVGSEAAGRQPGAWLALGERLTAGPEGAELLLPDGQHLPLAAGTSLCLDADVLADPQADAAEAVLSPDSLPLLHVLLPEATWVDPVVLVPSPAAEPAPTPELPHLDALLVAAPLPDLPLWGLDFLLEETLRLPAVTDSHHPAS